MQITDTPWGTPQTIDVIAPGIAFVTTASHGGYFLAPAQNEQVPLHWREISFKGLALAGWYEEDADWSMVAIIHPYAFIPEEIRIARATAEHWLDKKLYRGAISGLDV
jgi:hypothetical protein